MFWSPAVITLSVVWAAAAPANASAAARATKRTFIFILLGAGLNGTSSRNFREKKQRLARHHHAGGAALGETLGGVDPDLGAVGAHAIAIALTDVDGLCDHALQDEVRA